jgi:surface antigen
MAYGAQCMDLIRFYLKDFNLPQLPKGNAVDQWRDTQGYARIKNTIQAVPQPGDIVIWNKTRSNPYGHIAVVVEANWFYMTVLEQNNPLNAPVQVNKRSYFNCLGWLRPLAKPIDQEVVKYYFSQIWGRLPLEGELRVFWYRVLLGDIKNRDNLKNTIKYWKGIAEKDDERWQREKSKITKRAEKAGIV